MVDKGLVDYFSTGIKNGFSFETLKAKALESGYSELDISLAYGSLDSNLTRDSTEKIGFFRKIALAFSHPSELFEKTADERISSPFGFYMLMAIFSFIVSAISIYFSIGSFMSIIYSAFSSYTDAMAIPSDVSSSVLTSLGVGIWVTIFLGLAGVIFIGLPILTFVYSGFLHLFFRMFGGAGSYADTFRVGVYAVIPSSLLGFIPIVNFFVYLWSFILSLTGFSIVHKISKLKAFFVMILPTIIILFLVVFIVVLIGLSCN